MPNLDPTVARTRSRLAVAHRGRDPETITHARREHAVAVLRTYIKRIVAAAPPLTVEQRDELAAILRSRGGDPA